MNIFFKSRLTRFFSLSFVLTVAGYSVNAQTGAVSIAESKVAPHPSAMLDISATDKALLIPRITAATMEGINPVTDGLLVFVTDLDKKGFWYYDAYQKKWIKLRLQNSQKDIVAPKGGIMMYSGPLHNFDATGKGKTGTTAEGWVLCNGQNGSPNLEGKFIVGGKKAHPDYSMIGRSGGESKHLFSINEMPEHTHAFDDSKLSVKVNPHKHNVIDPGHSHSFDTDNWDFPWNFWDNPQNGCYGDKGGGGRSSDYYSDSQITGVTLQPSGSLNVTFSFQNDFIQEAGEGKDSFDNRPPYYVLAYIMKTNGTGNYSAQTPYTY